MPFTISESPCKTCGVSNKRHRLKFHRKNNKYYIQSSCVDCEKKAFQKYQKENREYFREAGKKSYLKKVGQLSRSFERSPEEKRQRAADKANRRSTRAKQARRNDELTLFVYSEAHELRKLRNSLTCIEWHVDHIVPLKGKNVSGLHVWNNFAVIPKVENLRKGNKNSVHEKG